MVKNSENLDSNTGVWVICLVFLQIACLFGWNRGDIVHFTAIEHVYDRRAALPGSHET